MCDTERPSIIEGFREVMVYEDYDFTELTKHMAKIKRFRKTNFYHVLNQICIETMLRMDNMDMRKENIDDLILHKPDIKMHPSHYLKTLVRWYIFCCLDNGSHIIDLPSLTYMLAKRLHIMRHNYYKAKKLQKEDTKCDVCEKKKPVSHVSVSFLPDVWRSCNACESCRKLLIKEP